MDQENETEFKQQDELADLNALSRRIVSLYHVQRYVEMEAAARQLQVALPQHSAGYEYLALVLKKQERYLEALTAYEEAIALNPDSVMTRVNYAACLNDVEHYEAAIGHARHALNLEPANLGALINLGNALSGLERYSEAQPHYQHALQLEPQQPDVLVSLAAIAFKQGRLDAARSMLEQALSIQPHMIKAYSNLSQVECQEGHLQRAIATMRRAIELRVAHLRQQPHHRRTEIVKPYMSVSPAGDTLLALKDFLDGLGVPFFIAYGTLLGIYRDGDLLPFDKDMDIGLPWDIDRAWLIEQISRNGDWQIKGAETLQAGKAAWNFAVIHRTTGIITDFFFFKPDGDTLLSGFDHLPTPLLWRFSRIDKGRIRYRAPPCRPRPTPSGFWWKSTVKTGACPTRTSIR